MISGNMTTIEGGGVEERQEGGAGSQPCVTLISSNGFSWTLLNSPGWPANQSSWTAGRPYSSPAPAVGRRPTGPGSWSGVSAGGPEEVRGGLSQTQQQPQDRIISHIRSELRGKEISWLLAFIFICIMKNQLFISL